ncbi:hypothetical protein ES703_74706 [subsurface metagenome]
MTHIRISYFAAQRGYINNFTPLALFYHLPGYSPGTQKYTFSIDLHSDIPIFFFHIHHRINHNNTGVIGQNINPTKMPYTFLSHLIYLINLSYIHLEYDSLTLHFFYSSHQPVGPADILICYQNSSSFLHKIKNDSSTNTPCSSGNNSYFIKQSHIVLLSFYSRLNFLSASVKTLSNIFIALSI